MKTVETIAEVRAWRADAGVVGLVPTMGFLHEGHLSLVHRARSECEAVAVSIFVNPSQFDRRSDLDHYPRDLDRDLEMLREAGCDLVFVPSATEMYPPGFQTWVEPGEVAEPNEGTHRAGHFRGVATVVLKLFGIFRAQRAYFGRKDAQQLAVVRRLARDLDVDTEVVPVATVREPDGLAMSSRNALLSPSERRTAAVIYRALCAGRDAWHDGERNAEEIRRRTRRILAEESTLRVDYVSLAAPDSFAELDHVEGPAVLSLAAFLGKARLIDNILIGEPD